MGSYPQIDRVLLPPRLVQLLKYEGSVLSGGIYLTDTIGFPENDDLKFRKDL